jgi:RNA methyltransferase, TrmH family
MTIITSPQNPRVKDAVRLRDRRHREKQGRILIDGARELARAIAAGAAVLEVFVCESLCVGDDARRVLAVLPKCGAETLEVSEPVFAKLAFGQRAEGVLGVAEMPMPKLDDLEAKMPWGGTAAAVATHAPAATAAELPASPLLAVLEGVEKPGNLGAVMRSADGAGLSALIAADARTDLYNPNAIRASLGTIFTLPVCSAASDETLDWLRRHSVAIVAARVDGKTPYTKVDFRGPTAIVLGSEAEGLSSIWSASDVTAVRLPMLGAADSLNVSAAAAVLFYEARRQRSEEGRRHRP